MAITQSSATLDQSERTSLLDSPVNSDILNGGASAGSNTVELAGITKNFADLVSKEIDNYIKNVDAEVDKMQAIKNDSAFKGTQINEALKNFVESVKTVATQYTEKLKNAEQQIINSVADVYSQQDTHISDSLGTDGSELDRVNPGVDA